MKTGRDVPNVMPIAKVKGHRKFSPSAMLCKHQQGIKVAAWHAASKQLGCVISGASNEAPLWVPPSCEDHHNSTDACGCCCALTLKGRDF